MPSLTARWAPRSAAPRSPRERGAFLQGAAPSIFLPGLNACAGWRGVDLAQFALLACVGAAAGYFSALFGVGGGIVMVPLLHYGLKVEWHTATALSLLAIAIMAPSAVFQHARRGAVSWRLAVPLAMGGVGGVFIGQWLEPHVPVPDLKLFFAALLLFAAWRMGLAARRKVPVAAVDPGPQSEPLPAKNGRGRIPGAVGLIALGVVNGISSKLLGIGGGLISVPVLSFLGTAMHVAVGSSLVPVFTNGAISTAAKLATGVPLWRGIPMAAGGLVAIPLGAWTAHALHADRLKLAFAGAMTLAALY